MDDDEIRRRVAALQEAAGKLDECMELVESATRMSPVSRRAQEKLLPRLRECRDSVEADSIANIIKDLEHLGEDHPVWTRPLTSVKYIDRRD